MKNRRENFLISGIVLIVFGALFSLGVNIAMGGVVGLSGITTGIDGALEKSNIGQDGQSPLKRKLITSHSACLSLMGNVEVVGYCDLADDRIDNFKNIQIYK